MNLKEIGKEIKTQDNMATENPFFILFDHELVPTDSDYSDKYLYCYNKDDYTEIGDTKESVMEFCKDNDIELPENIQDMGDWDFNEWIEEHKHFSIMYFLKKRVYRQCFFTEQSAEKYLKGNVHHFRDPLIWCDTLYRNYEMQAIRNALIEGRFVDEPKK